ncbi:MAG TPA: protocatechuate 3,4-dioxygenase subunit alpha [Candidatus Sulfotelmatobacter sp.]|nr:protocatechuate 3,4-dioxygenase subunit alpha [Candidatus Sulfotelmatobacter sp.]
MPGIVTPSQTVGPFLRLGLSDLNTTDLTLKTTAGERITIAGSVLDGDRQPVPDAMLDIWQANAQGKYAHPDDTQEKPLDPGFSGFGRIPTDAAGKFRFTTIKPGPVPGRGNTLQAPHILVALFMRGLLRHLYTRIYFSDSPGNAADPVLALVEDARRDTLIARRPPGGGDYRWDVILQGEGETVFFDC